MRIVQRAIEEPSRWIAQNAGVEGSVVVNRVKESSDPQFGYNALTGEFENLVECGVLDPTKVVRFALQNAASVAGLMLTTEALVTEIPEKTKESGGAPDTGMDDF